MATAYTSILKLALPVQGELSGTWGDVVNDNITSMVEEAIAGRAVINTWTTNSHTLTSADGTTSESRCAMLEFTDTGTALTGDATVVCPAQSKIYICKNDSGQKVTIKTSAGTGVAIADGQTMFVFCDGTNVVEAVTSMSSLKLGTVATSVQVTAILDEDNMASDSATSLATQQSIKAYVDSQVTAQDLDFAGDSGTGSVDLDSQSLTIAGTSNEIETSASGQTLTVGLPDAVTVTTSVTTPTVQATNVKANDGTTAVTIADSTGQTTIADAVLTTADINAGTIDNTTIGATTATTGAFTTVTSSGNTTVSGSLVTDTIAEETATAGVTVDGLLVKDTGIGVADASGTDVVGSDVTVRGGAGTGTGAGGDLLFKVAPAGSTGSSPNSLVTSMTIDGSGAVSIGGYDFTVDTNTLYVDSTNNRVGIGSTSPQEKLLVNDQAATVGVTLAGSGAAADTAITGGLGFRNLFSATTGHIATLTTKTGSSTDRGDLIFSTSSASNIPAEAMRIDSSQRLLIGTTSDGAIGSKSANLQVRGNSGQDAAITIVRNDAGVVGGSFFVLGKSRGNDEGDATIVNDDDTLGTIRWSGADGTDVSSIAAEILGQVDGTPGSNDMPGRIVFSTTADGASAATERMRINNAGYVKIGDAADPSYLLHVGGSTGGAHFAYDKDNNDLWLASEYDASGATDVVFTLKTRSGGNWRYGGIWKDANKLRLVGGGTNSNITANTTAVTIDEAEQLIAGHSDSLDIGSTASAQIQAYNSSVQLSIARFNASGSPALFMMGSAKTTTIGDADALASGDGVGEIRFSAADGTDIQSQAATIAVDIDGTVGSNDTPGRMVFSTTSDGSNAATERMRIDNAGLVTIGDGGGAITPLRIKKTVSDTIDLDKTYNVAPKGAWLELYNPGGTTGGGVGISALGLGTEGRYAAIAMTDQTSDNSGTGGDIEFWTSPSKTGALSEAMRIDGNGRLLIGVEPARGTVFGASTYHPQFQLEGTDSEGSSGLIVRNQNGTGGPYLVLGKTRATATRGVTIVSDGDTVGRVSFQGADGTNLEEAAYIQAQIDGTPGNNDMPGRLGLFTTADGSAAPTERMRISSDGHMGFGETNTDDIYYQFKKSVTDYSGDFATYNLGQMDSFRFYQSATTKWAKVFARSYQTPNQFGTQNAILEVMGHGSTGGNGHFVTLHVTTKQQQGSDGWDIYATGNNGYNVAYKFDATGGHESAGLLEIWVQPQENYVTTCLWVKTSQRRGDPTSEPVAWFGLEDTGSETQPTGSTTVQQHNPFMGLHYKDGATNGTYETSENFQGWYPRLNINRYLDLGGQGTTKPTIGGSDNAIATISGTSNRAALNFFQSQSGSDGAKIRFAKGRSNSINGVGTAASNGDQTGIIINYVDDGNDLGSYSSYINFKVDGAVSSNDTPGRIEFATTADGASASTERMRINNKGHVLIGATSSPTAGSTGDIFILNDTIFVSEQISPPSPYTQNLQIDITWNSWGSNNVVGLVELDFACREWTATSGVAFGRIFATNSGAASTFSTFNTTDVTTSACTVTAASGGNYTLRITINPSNNVDRVGYSLRIPTSNGGTGSSVYSVVASLV